MLTLRLVCVGRMKAGAEREICSRYVTRAASAGRPLGLAVEIFEIAESRAREPHARKAAEAAAIRGAIGDKSPLLIVFDETGRPIASSDFAAIVRTTLAQGGGTACVVIGGPDGLDPNLRRNASHVIALGAMTWPHQLARIMVAEQIYRAITILGGHPYHRV